MDNVSLLTLDSVDSFGNATWNAKSLYYFLESKNSLYSIDLNRFDKEIKLIDFQSPVSLFRPFPDPSSFLLVIQDSIAHVIDIRLNMVVTSVQLASHVSTTCVHPDGFSLYGVCV